MASLNKVQLIGNLGKDPELKYTPAGDAVTTLSIATTRAWKDKTGERHEETEWTRVVYFGRLAEVASDYLRKGKSCFIEGRLRTTRWTDRDGIQRFTTDVVGSELILLAAPDSSRPPEAPPAGLPPEAPLPGNDGADAHPPIEG